MTINKSIKECRNSKGVTQIQMAEQLGVSDRYIRLLESGDRKITVDILMHMADILNCSLDELVGRDKKLKGERNGFDS